MDDGTHEHHRNGALQEHLKKLPSLMQQLTGDRESLKTKNALLAQFVYGLSHDLNDCHSSQKKYKVKTFLHILFTLIISCFAYFSIKHSYSKHIQNNNNYY